MGRAYVDMFEEHWRQAWIAKKVFRSVAFLTICSHAKPYSKSFIHSSIRKRLYEEGVLHRCDYIHISNAGIIPSEAEMNYPFNAYDWNGNNCTPEVVEYHKQAIVRRFKEWFNTYSHRYQDLIVYLRDGGNTNKCVSIARKELGATFQIVSAQDTEFDRMPFAELPDPDDCLTSTRNLNKLMESFSSLKSYKP